MISKAKKRQNPKKGPRSQGAQRLLAEIMRGKDTTLKQKVAHTLNHFPAARDSDITLTIRLLNTFYRDYIDEEGKICLEDLYQLPKFYDMQRLRAQIQNEYGLFRASPEVQVFRRNHQFARAEEFAAGRPDYNSVFVFSDESGKDQDYLVFGSLWIYSPNEHISILKDIAAWRSKKRYNDEIHFRNIKNQEKAALAIEFFKTVIQSGCYISFKCLLVHSKGVNSSRMVDAMYDGITYMLSQGVKSEFRTQRVKPPLRVRLAKDADPATDLLKLADLNLKTMTVFQTLFPDGKAVLEGVSNPESNKSDLIQIADIFTASVGRWINQGVPTSMDNPKELVARQIGDMLLFKINKEGRIVSRGDLCDLEYFSPDVEIS